MDETPSILHASSLLFGDVMAQETIRDVQAQVSSTRGSKDETWGELVAFQDGVNECGSLAVASWRCMAVLMMSTGQHRRSMLVVCL